jgi:hypothetical protein
MTWRAVFPKSSDRNGILMLQFSRKIFKLFSDFFEKRPVNHGNSCQVHEKSMKTVDKNGNGVNSYEKFGTCMHKFIITSKLNYAPTR